MMRYHRVSPDYLPLSNGRKPSLRTCKDDDADTNGRLPLYSPFETKAVRIRSGSGAATDPHSSSSPDASHLDTQPSSSSAAAAVPKINTHNEINAVGSGGGGDLLLQWGHNKRSRGSRAESRTAGDESSLHSRQVIKIQRRGIGATDKLSSAAAVMPPPPPCGSSYTRGANLRPCTPVRDFSSAPLLHREERSTTLAPRSEKRSPPSPPEKAHTKMAAVASAAANGDAHPSHNPHHHHESKQPSDQETTGSGHATTAGSAEKLNLEQFEWPRIYVSLSRKEKEDDFLAMKGTKLPQRPKKRAKNIDKTLQYCFPGMWLSDLTRGRYEVREKKCVKKKRRGLKGMESMDSDSE